MPPPPNLILHDTPTYPDQLTVSAWVRADDDRAEGLQVIASQWRLRQSFDRFAGFDASHINGLETSGYFGAVFDGRHIYFCPELHPDGGHGVVLRYDTHADFHDPSAYQAHDANPTDGLETRGYYGGVFDGNFVYFIPRHCDGYNHSHLLRYDPRRDFRDPASWSAFDFGERQDHQGAAFDGRYIYFCPGYRQDQEGKSRLSGRVIRYDTHAEFYDPNSYQRFDAEGLDGLAVGCYDGGAFDGRHIYFIPLSTGIALRYDTHRPFAKASSWQTRDGGSIGLGMCVGSVFDGRYLYYVPYGDGQGRVVRFDTEGDFQSLEAWTMFDAGVTDGLDTRGFDGGFFDGRYVYFVPFFFDGHFHARWLRYDTQMPFENPEAWAAHEAPSAHGVRIVGYNGGAFDGRFFYAAPWRSRWGKTMAEWDIHGRIARYDTLGDEGAFSLRYCDYGHNGGLCAAVPGPAFLVNTAQGIRSIATHRPLAPGRHHLAGVYDGVSLKLYIDGKTAAERTATGALLDCQAPIVTGRIEGGGGLFRGEIEQVVVARDAKWIKKTW